MKKLLCLLVALASMVSVSAFAAHKVGDKVTYDLFAKMAGQEFPGTMLVTVTALDLVTRKVTTDFTIDWFGQKTTQTNETDMDASSEEAGALVVQNCVQKGGKLETVHAAGLDIETCAFTHIEGTKTTITNVGAVPGIAVKNSEMDSSTGDLSTLTLTSITRGL